MIRFIPLFLLVLFFLEQPANAQSKDSKERLFELGHFEERFASSQILILDLVEQLTQNEDQRPIVDVIADSYSSEEMKLWALESIERNLKTDTADSVLAFSDSTDFYTFIELIYANNLDFDNDDVKADFEDYLVKLENTADSDARFSIIQRIMNATRIIPITVQMLEDVLSTVIFGLNITLDEDQRLSDREVNDLIITLRLNFRELFNNVIPVTSLYVTRNYSISDLESYTMFLESNTGHWFLRTGNTATLDSFGAFAQKTSERIASWSLEQSENATNE